MTFNILKHQVKYCLLNKEDQELDKMIQKREIKDFSANNNLTSLKQNNEDFFQIKEEYDNKVSKKTMQLLQNSEKLGTMPTRKEATDNNNIRQSKKKSKSKDKKNKFSSKHQEL